MCRCFCWASRPVAPPVGLLIEFVNVLAMVLHHVAHELAV